MLSVVKTEIRGENLFVTVQADGVEEATSPAARRLAYDERLTKGFANAGIEAFGGPFPVSPDGKDLDPSKPVTDPKKLVYRNQFKLTRGL